MKLSYFAMLVAVVGSIACLGGCSTEYSAAAISARVVDAETGQPVAGVNIVAHWQLEGGLEGGSALGALTAMEAQTDENGRFLFPAWGPKEAPKFSSWVNFNARIQNLAPQFLLFKSGYKYMQLQNYPYEKLDQKNMRSEWNGKTIKLEPFHGSPTEYVKHMQSLSSTLEYAIATSRPNCSADKPCPEACQWQNAPKMIRAIGRQFKEFDAGSKYSDNIFDSLLLNEEALRRWGCASAAAVLGGELK